VTLRYAPQSRDRAPVWVPRNGDYYVITCTDCLRSFSIAAEKDVRALRELRTLECVFCDAQVQFIVEEKPEAPGLPSIKTMGTHEDGQIDSHEGRTK
jgi:hypothetical protein